MRVVCLCIRLFVCLFVCAIFCFGGFPVCLLFAVGALVICVAVVKSHRAPCLGMLQAVAAAEGHLIHPRTMGVAVFRAGAHQTIVVDGCNWTNALPLQVCILYVFAI